MQSRLRQVFLTIARAAGQRRPGRPEIFEETLTNSIALSGHGVQAAGVPFRLGRCCRPRHAGGVQRRRLLGRRARAVAEGGRGALHRLRRGARRPGRHPHQRDQRPRHVRRRLSIPGVDARRARGAELRRRSAPTGVDPECDARVAAALADQRATGRRARLRSAHRAAAAGRHPAVAAAAWSSVGLSAAQ